MNILDLIQHLTGQGVSGAVGKAMPKKTVGSQLGNSTRSMVEQQFTQRPDRLLMNPDGTGGGYATNRGRQLPEALPSKSFKSVPKPMQKTNQLRVQQNYGMQGFGRGQEDSYSPLDALTQRSYGGGQTTVHGGIQQGGMNRQIDPQYQQDIIRKYLGY